MPVCIGFLLVPLFPMYAVVLATEMLQLANKYAARQIFDWVFITDGGGSIEASNGIRIDSDVSLEGATDLSYVFVVAGDDQTRTLTRRIRNWLLRISKSKTILGAVDSGAFLLAECHLIGARRVTVHPLAAAAFREQYPNITVRDEPVVRDGGLLTCAGGVSIVNMMLSVIEDRCGKAIAQSVADDMVVNMSRFGISLIAPGNGKNPSTMNIADIVKLMQADMEEPISLQTLSARAGLSRRHISRMFQRNFGLAPIHYYRTLRLTYAKQLLFQSDLSISEIAVASGFQSLSSFSRCFSAEFGCSPRGLLARLRRDGNSSSVPMHHSSKHIRLHAGGYWQK